MLEADDLLIVETGEAMRLGNRIGEGAKLAEADVAALRQADHDLRELRGIAAALAVSLVGAVELAGDFGRGQAMGLQLGRIECEAKPRSTPPMRSTMLMPLIASSFGTTTESTK